MILEEINRSVNFHKDVEEEHRRLSVYLLKSMYVTSFGLSILNVFAQEKQELNAVFMHLYVF